MTEPTPLPGIHRAMFNVKSEIPTLQKLGEGPKTQGSYKFLGIDEIMSHIKPLFVKNGIQVYPSLDHHETEFHMAGQTVSLDGTPISDGRVPQVRVREFVIYSYVFVYIEDGSAVTVKVSGEAMDSQDKSSRKAATSAWKTCLIQTFDIITGEPDPDAIDGAADAQRAPEPVKKDRGQQMADRARPTVRKIETPVPDKFVSNQHVEPEVQADPKTGVVIEEPDAVNKIRAELRQMATAKGWEPAQMGEFGKTVTGKEPAVYLKQISELRKIKKALEAQA